MEETVYINVDNGLGKIIAKQLSVVDIADLDMRIADLQTALQKLLADRAAITTAKTFVIP